MLDGTDTFQRLQRARGEAAVRLGPAGLVALRQSGSGKAFLPRGHAGVPEIVFLNTAGGLTGGDRMSFRVTLDAAARATATTQAAERVYRSAGGRAEVDVDLRVGSGSALAWIPQETILFEGAGLSRRTTAELDGDASLLLCEMTVLGRAAMGETLRRVDVRDWREVRRAGRPVLVDPLRLDDPTLARAGAPALLGGARALALVALVAPGAEDAVAAVRQALPDGAAASGWDGRCVVRVLAPGAREVRRAVASALSVLGRRPLPTVWRMGGF